MEFLNAEASLAHTIFCVFRTYGKGEVSGLKRTQLFFQTVFFFFINHIESFFGPSKHVLHLVWSALVISTTIKTALKVALNGLLNGKFSAKVDHYNRREKKIYFGLGPSVKLVLPFFGDIYHKC